MNWELGEQILIFQLCEIDKLGKVNDERSPLWGFSLVVPNAVEEVGVSIGMASRICGGDREDKMLFLFVFCFSDETRICI